MFSGPTQPGRSKNLQRRGRPTASEQAVHAAETAGEAAVRREEDQRQTAAARDGERLDTVDNGGDITRNYRDIRPPALIVLLGLFYDGMLPTYFSLFIPCTTGLRTYIHRTLCTVGSSLSPQRTSGGDADAP